MNSVLQLGVQFSASAEGKSERSERKRRLVNAYGYECCVKYTIGLNILLLDV